MAQARIRSIKPDIWESGRIGRRSLLARMTFIGLISLADDMGRGRAGSAFLFGRLHPYAKDITPENFNRALQELVNISDEEKEAGKKPLVVLYEIAGDYFYFLPGWFEHQNIDRPSESALPPPPGWEPIPTRGSGVKGTKPVGARPWLAIVEIWNAKAPAGLGRVKEVSVGRDRHLKARWSEHPEPIYWENVIQEIGRSSFLQGMASGGRGWKASIDFLLRPDSATKIIEGQYRDNGGRAGAAAPKAGKYAAAI